MSIQTEEAGVLPHGDKVKIKIVSEVDQQKLIGSLN